MLYLYLFERRASWVTERYNTDNQLIGGIIFCGIIIIAALISSILQDLGVVDDIRSLLVSKIIVSSHYQYTNYIKRYERLQSICMCSTKTTNRYTDPSRSSGGSLKYGQGKATNSLPSLLGLGAMQTLYNTHTLACILKLHAFY